MANHPKITVTSHVLPTAYLAIFFAAVKCTFKDLKIKEATALRFENAKRKGSVHIFIYWFKFDYK